MLLEPFFSYRGKGLSITRLPGLQGAPQIDVPISGRFEGHVGIRPQGLPALLPLLPIPDDPIFRPGGTHLQNQSIAVSHRVGLVLSLRLLHHELNQGHAPTSRITVFVLLRFIIRVRSDLT